MNIRSLRVRDIAAVVQVAAAGAKVSHMAPAYWQASRRRCCWRRTVTRSSAGGPACSRFELLYIYGVMVSGPGIIHSPLLQITGFSHALAPCDPRPCPRDNNTTSYTCALFHISNLSYHIIQK
jgi:hypothetical protein